MVADETKDSLKKELLSTVLRYYNACTGKVVKRFIGFTHLERLGAEDITKEILGKVEWCLKLSLNNCVSVTFDGVSIMSGTISGVKEYNPTIIYIHCFTHI